MKIKTILPAITTAGLLLVSAQASAGGFALIENSASGMGNAFAGGAASAEDASTIWFNPAGMTRLDNEMMMAAHVIIPNASFTDTGSTAAATVGSGSLDTGGTGGVAEGGKSALVPNLYWVNEIQKDLKVGFGVTVPFGLGTEYDDDWVGRYHAVKSDLMSLNLNPSIAYKTGALSVGFGVNAQYISVVLSSAIDAGGVCLAAEGGGVLLPGTCAAVGASSQANDGFADLDGDGWGYNYNFGLLYELENNARLGFSYRSKIDHEVTGNADYTLPAEVAFLFTDTTLSASVSLPATTSVSYFQNVNDQIAIMFDYSLTEWSGFEELRIEYDNTQPDSVTTQAWEDSARISIGMNYRATEKLLYRFGVALDETPIPSAERRTPRMPGNDRTWISAGISYQLDKDRSVSFGYAHLMVDETEINNTYESTAPTITHTLKGKYDASVDIVSVQVSWKYE